MTDVTEVSMQTEAVVLLDEVISLLGGSTEAADTWVHRLKVKPGQDWSGRATVTGDEAKRIVANYKAAMAQNAADLSAYDQYVRGRTAQLVEYCDKAYHEVAERELQLQYSTKPGPAFAEGGVRFTHPLSLWPGGRANARTAGLEAYRAFEQKEPLLDFTEWQKRRKR